MLYMMSLEHKELGGLFEMPEENLEDYSGRISLRVPKSLHKKIMVAAQREGVSANLYLTHLISLGLGEKVAQEDLKEG